MDLAGNTKEPEDAPTRMTPRDLPPGDTAVSMAIVDAVADAVDVDPAALSPPLHDAIDTEALNALVGNSMTTDQTTICVTFPYHGYEITVRGDGNVSVEERFD